MRDLAEKGERPTDVRAAQLLRTSRTVIWAWKQNPDFLKWFAAAMETGHNVEWEAAKARMYGLAIQGSARHFEAIARVRSIGQKGGVFTPDGEAPTNIQVNILVPRPPELPETVGGGSV